MPTISSSTDGTDQTAVLILGANPFVGLTREQVAAALGRFLQPAAGRPGVVIGEAVGVGRQLVDVVAGRSDVAPAPGDKRFTHAAWTSNPLFHRLEQAYLVQTRALLALVDDLDLDAKSRERARFALSLLTEAAAPTNTLPGNPKALSRAVETRGRSLLAGARHFAHDARHNRGMPSTVDTRPFSVGGNVAVMPGRVVHRAEAFELIQYAPSTRTAYRRPLVAIPPPDQQVLHHGHRAGPEPRRAHRGGGGAVLRHQLAEPDRRPACLGSRHVCRRLQGGRRGCMRHQWDG